MRYTWFLALVTLFNTTQSIDIQPVVYFSDIVMTPLSTDEDQRIVYSFNNDLAYASRNTVFTFSYANKVIHTFAKIPGTYFTSEFIIPHQEVLSGSQVLLLRAENERFTCSLVLEVETRRQETIVINERLGQDKELSLIDSLLLVDSRGKKARIAENYFFTFEETIWSDDPFAMRLDDLTFQYQLADFELAYQAAEVIIWGTADDFPRLLFDDDIGGYRFQAIIHQREDRYQLDWHETFYVDPTTHMISRSSGDYFQETQTLYLSETRRAKSEVVRFQVTIKGVGVHQTTLVYDGQYRFSTRPLGSCGNSAVCLHQEDVDPRLSENWEEWS